MHVQRQCLQTQCLLANTGSSSSRTQLYNLGEQNIPVSVQRRNFGFVGHVQVQIDFIKPCGKRQAEVINVTIFLEVSGDLLT